MLPAPSLDPHALPEPVPVTLVLGGARSGKSLWAERLALDAASDEAGAAVYIATAQAFDAEMEERIAGHQLRRGSVWSTVEAPLALPSALARAAGDARRPVLIDCVTLWLSNLMLGERPVEPALEAFDTVLGAAKAPVVVVSNEVGQGIVPETPLGRRFRDLQGLANQRLAARSQRVIYCLAGLALVVKDATVPPGAPPGDEAPPFSP